jgi:hypothetical protein
VSGAAWGIDRCTQGRLGSAIDIHRNTIDFSSEIWHFQMFCQQPKRGP